MRFQKVKVVEKKKYEIGYMEDKLNEFLAMKVPYAEIIIEDDDYRDIYCCTASYNIAIKRYHKEDLIACRTINKRSFLMNKKLATWEGVKK